MPPGVSEAWQIHWGDSGFLLDSCLAVVGQRHLHSERIGVAPQSTGISVKGTVSSRPAPADG